RRRKSGSRAAAVDRERLTRSHLFPTRSLFVPALRGPRKMLTAKQRELLLFIHGRLGDSGVSPSFDEMREALSLKSKSGVHRLISALEERGFIRRLPNRARALEVVKLPEGSVSPPAAIRPVIPAAANDT